MVVYFVDEFIEIVFVAGAEVDEGLDGLIRVSGDVLSLAGFNDANHIINERGEICDAIVDICRLVDSDELFIENCE